MEIPHFIYKPCKIINIKDNHYVHVSSQAKASDLCNMTLTIIIIPSTCDLAHCSARPCEPVFVCRGQTLDPVNPSLLDECPNRIKKKYLTHSTHTHT